MGDGMYQLTPNDAIFLPEFLQRERRDFSLELRRILNRLRLVPIAGREVIVAVEPNKTYRLARMGAHRGQPVSYIDDRLFTDHKRAEYEILKMRWRRLTGLPFPGE
jgi:hypothetical protein